MKCDNYTLAEVDLSVPKKKRYSVSLLKAEEERGLISLCEGTFIMLSFAAPCLVLESLNIVDEEDEATIQSLLAHWIEKTKEMTRFQRSKCAAVVGETVVLTEGLEKILRQETFSSLWHPERPTWYKILERESLSQ